MLLPMNSDDVKEVKKCMNLTLTKTFFKIGIKLYI